MTTCSECSAPTSGRCLNCKSNKYYQELGFRVDACSACGVTRKLCSNGECRRCLTAAGMKECGRCREILIAAMDFHGGQGTCKGCRHPLAHLTAAERSKHSSYLKKYKISYDDYLSIAESQGWLCAICKKKRALVVDHDRAAQRVRGLLCSQCSVGVEMLQENPANLTGALSYLKREPVHPDDLPVTARKGGAGVEALQAEVELLRELLRSEREDFRNKLAAAPNRDVFDAVIRSSMKMVERDRRLGARSKARVVEWLGSLLHRL